MFSVLFSGLFSLLLALGASADPPRQYGPADSEQFASDVVRAIADGEGQRALALMNRQPRWVGVALNRLHWTLRETDARVAQGVALNAGERRLRGPLYRELPGRQSAYRTLLAVRPLSEWGPELVQAIADHVRQNPADVGLILPFRNVSNRAHRQIARAAYAQVDLEPGARAALLERLRAGHRDALVEIQAYMNRGWALDAVERVSKSRVADEYFLALADHMGRPEVPLDHSDSYLRWAREQVRRGGRDPRALRALTSSSGGVEDHLLALEAARNLPAQNDIRDEIFALVDETRTIDDERVRRMVMTYLSDLYPNGLGRAARQIRRSRARHVWNEDLAREVWGELTVLYDDMTSRTVRRARDRALRDVGRNGFAYALERNVHHAVNDPHFRARYLQALRAHEGGAPLPGLRLLIRTVGEVERIPLFFHELVVNMVNPADQMELLVWARNHQLGRHVGIHWRTFLNWAVGGATPQVRLEAARILSGPPHDFSMLDAIIEARRTLAQRAAQAQAPGVPRGGAYRAGTGDLALNVDAQVHEILGQALADPHPAMLEAPVAPARPVRVEVVGAGPGPGQHAVRIDVRPEAAASNDCGCDPNPVKNAVAQNLMAVPRDAR